MAEWNDPAFDIEFNYIGKSGLPRKDGYLKASGKAVFMRDVMRPGMLYAKCLHSPYAHAKILSMDTSKAEALPGVRAVLRYDDPVCYKKWWGIREERRENEMLPEIAHYEGEPAGAVVAADSEEIAEEAIKLIDIQWEERPFILNIEDALEPGANLIYPEKWPESNLENESIRSKGDVEVAFEEADGVVEFTVHRTEHVTSGAEANSAIAEWNGDYLHFWLRDQHPMMYKNLCSGYNTSRIGHPDFDTFDLGIPESFIRTNSPYQGCSFGGHSSYMRQYFWHTQELSKRTGRPVRITFSRAEDFQVSAGSEDFSVTTWKVGFKNNGKITAVHLTNHGGNPRSARGIDHFEENTSIHNLTEDWKAACVNRHRTRSVRCEQLINSFGMCLVTNRVAAELGMDATEVALINDGYEGNDWEWLKNVQVEYMGTDRWSLKECIDAGKAAIDWDSKWHEPGTKKLANGKMHGMAMMWTHEWNSKRGNGTGAVKVEHDGSVRLFGCRADIGVNAESTYCQIVADVLGAKFEDVSYAQWEDTGFYPMTPDGSCNLITNTFLFRKAAAEARRQLLALATELELIDTRGRGNTPPPLGDYTAEELDIKDGFIFEKANPDNKWSIEEIVAPYYGTQAQSVSAPCPIFGVAQQATSRVPMGSYDEETGAKGSPVFTRQAHFMEVEVDPDTGEVEVVNTVGVNDGGKVMCPEGFAAQGYGGLIPAIGRGRSEEMIYDPQTGVMLNGTSLGYKIPVFEDAWNIKHIAVETGTGYGPWGSVGIGEDNPDAPMTLVGPAVFNAIGEWIYEFPVTPDRVLKAMGKA